ncbi:sigma factor [Levilactobacillus sp. N40-8-2]|uniref:sigma factor n=1 Tax=Levilactobacillus muriae TaxID=3238987 RepID=UPI0038B30A35
MIDLSDTQLLFLIRESLDSPALLILFERYRPVLFKIQSKYFIPDHDRDDWDQEALLVFCRVVQRYEIERMKSFGAFYRRALLFRVYDLIRQSQTQKRVEDRLAVSLEANRIFISETVKDTRGVLREGLEVKDAIRQVGERLSVVERGVFNDLLQGQSLQGISRDRALSLAQVTSAAHRSQIKLRAVFAE